MDVLGNALVICKLTLGFVLCKETLEEIIVHEELMFFHVETMGVVVRQEEVALGFLS